MTTETQVPATETAWHTLAGPGVVAALDSDAEVGLSASEVQRRLTEHGPNSIPKEPPPSYFQVLLKALQDPMNLMLVAVAVASFLIGQTSTGIIVAVLVLLNVVMAANQELKANATVAALEDLQVPNARVVRDGSVAEVPAVDLVPGDIVMVKRVTSFPVTAGSWCRPRWRYRRQP